MITHTGSIIDATFVDVPKQQNTREENKTIKEGNIPENWKEDAEMNNRRASPAVSTKFFVV
jgi:hypothetical protein